MSCVGHSKLVDSLDLWIEPIIVDCLGVEIDNCVGLIMDFLEH